MSEGDYIWIQDGSYCFYIAFVSVKVSTCAVGFIKPHKSRLWLIQICLLK